MQSGGSPASVYPRRPMTRDRRESAEQCGRTRRRCADRPKLPNGSSPGRKECQSVQAFRGLCASASFALCCGLRRSAEISWSAYCWLGGRSGSKDERQRSRGRSRLCERSPRNDPTRGCAPEPATHVDVDAAGLLFGAASVLWDKEWRGVMIIGLVGLLSCISIGYSLTRRLKAVNLRELLAVAADHKKRLGEGVDIPPTIGARTKGIEWLLPGDLLPWVLGLAWILVIALRILRPSVAG
jgi:hypothetical protein